MTEKGKLIYLPPNSADAYEVDLEDLIGGAQPSLWERIKRFFGKKEEPQPMKLTKIHTPKVDINDLVCNKIEELISTAHWYPKSLLTSDPSFVLNVYPKEYEDSWEPVVTITLSNGAAVDVGLAELLINYEPEIEEVSDIASHILHN